MRKILLATFILCLNTSLIQAQVEPPNRLYLFEHDSPQFQKQTQQNSKSILSKKTAPSKEGTFEAPKMEFDQENQLIKGTNGVLVSKDGMQAQADSGTYNSKTKDVTLDGSVFLSWPEGDITSKSADFNLNNQAGNFFDADIYFDETQYSFVADKLEKQSADEYAIDNGWFSACDCPDNADGSKNVPWKISCREAKIKQEGYAKAKGVTFDMYDVPIFYSPYFFFPVKTKRQSGMLAPQFGYGNQDGVMLQTPYYHVTGASSDLTFSPFFQTRSRVGSQVDFRNYASLRNTIKGTLLYSNETLRDGDFRGTITEGLADKTIDDNRLGVYYSQNWRTTDDVLLPSQFVADIHYVSDDLMLRELNTRQLGQQTDQFTTSRMLLSSNWNPIFSTELSAEYNQAMLTDDDLIYQRLPELSLYGQKSFRPLGYNPYGFKVITGVDAASTYFSRKEGYDGMRTNLQPSIRMPHHYKNYVNAEFGMSLYQTNYNLSEVKLPNSTDEITGDSRSMYDVRYQVSTAVEKVYDVDQSSPLVWLTQLGANSQNETLTRIKNVIEPSINYHYVPFREQSDLPLFDSVDRLRDRSLFTYGMRSSWLGKFTPKTHRKSEIDEIRPELEDLPELGVDRSLSPWQEQMNNKNFSIREGVIREVAFLGIKQSYDYTEDTENKDPLRDSLSDIGLNTGVFPSVYTALMFDTNFNSETQDISSWSLSSHFRDDRGDVLRGRYTYIDGNLGQLEANVEFVLTERTQLGFYGRFDDRASEFIESRSALRLYDSCRCWSLDIGFSDQINPDRQQLLLALNYRGLGSLSQNLGYGNTNGAQQ